MTSETRSGLLLGLGSYMLWGLLPLYLKLLATVPAPQVIAHRVIWSLLLLGAIVVALRRVRATRTAARGRTLLLLCASATLMFVNWLVFIWAVNNGHALAGSLGYFINPLVSVALGVLVLGERLRRLQGVAIGIAALGVAVMAASGGRMLGIALILAVTFALYGLIRKVADIDALGGLTVETFLLAPICLAIVATAQAGGTSAFGHDARLDLLLIFAGAVTAAPLLMFTAAARKLPYSTLGLMQYIAPTMQFFEAVLLFGEQLRPIHLIVFGLIWAGCALFAWDGLRAARFNFRDRAADAP